MRHDVVGKKEPTSKCGVARLLGSAFWSNDPIKRKINFFKFVLKTNRTKKTSYFVQLLPFLGKFHKKWSDSKSSFIYFMNERERYSKTVNGPNGKTALKIIRVYKLNSTEIAHICKYILYYTVHM